MQFPDAVPLKVFAQGRSQGEVATLIGVTQGSVSQMINSDRDLWVRALPDGSFMAYEIRPVGRKTGEQQAA